MGTPQARGQEFTFIQRSQEKLAMSYLKSTWQCRYFLLNMFLSAVVGGIVGGLILIFSGTAKAEIVDDFGRTKPQSCVCTTAYCGGDEPCNTCTCEDGKVYKSW